MQSPGILLHRLLRTRRLRSIRKRFLQGTTKMTLRRVTPIWHLASNGRVQLPS